METPDTLRKKLNCDTDEELGALFFVGFKAVSAWRRNGVPDKILRRAEVILNERKIAADKLKPIIAFNQEEYGPSYTAEELELIKYYRQLCPDQKLMIIPMMKGLLNSPPKLEENDNRAKILKVAS